MIILYFHFTENAITERLKFVYDLVTNQSNLLQNVTFWLHTDRYLAGEMFVMLF